MRRNRSSARAAPSAAMTMAMLPVAEGCVDEASASMDQAEVQPPDSCATDDQDATADGKTTVAGCTATPSDGGITRSRP